MNEYNHEFYKNRNKDTIAAARQILTHTQTLIPKISSAVDYGCGVGAWLSVIESMGVNNIRGYDGPWVDAALLEIDRGNFTPVDMENPPKTDRAYDLCISLEVAEHISSRNASHFVDALTHSSDFILFSAAIPGQGGNHHVNEQWPNYWIEKFNERGFIAYDVLRPVIWNDPRIPYWYRQNTLLFASSKRAEEVNVNAETPNFCGSPLVHPETLNNHLNYLANLPVKKSAMSLTKAVIRLIKGTRT